MKKIFLITLLLSSLYAEQLVPNKVYEGGLKLTAKDLGLNFYLPLSWKGHIDKDLTFLMQHDQNLGFMMAKRTKISSAVSEMLEDYHLNEKITLKAVTKVKQISRTLYRIDYRGKGIYRNYQGIGYIVIGPQNRVVKVMGVFKEKNYTMMNNSTMHFVKSISFTAI